MSATPLTSWSIAPGCDNGYTAPEIGGLTVIGTRPDGKRIRTSRVVEVDGRNVTTETGSQYRLEGEPCIEYRTWLRENGKAYCEEQPIRVRP